MDRIRPSLNKENEGYHKLIKAFFLEDKKQELSYNEIMREVYLEFMVVNKIKTFIPEEDLKRFEMVRDNYLARTKE